jgi:hypothetical protein
MDSIHVLNSYKKIDKLSNTWDSELFKDRKQPAEISKITIHPESHSIEYISYISPDDNYHQYQAEVDADNVIQKYKDEMLNIVDVSKTSDVCNSYSKKIDHVIGGIPLYIELTESYLNSINAITPCSIATIRYKINGQNDIYTINGDHRNNKSYMFVFNSLQTMAWEAGYSFEFWIENISTNQNNIKYVKMSSASIVAKVIPRISYMTVGTYGIETVVHRNSTLAVRFFTEAINNMNINKHPGLYRGVIITPQIQFWYSFDEGNTFQYVDLCVKSDGFVQPGYVSNYMPSNFIAMLTLGNVVVPQDAKYMVFFFKVIDYGYGSIYFSNYGTNFFVEIL